MFLLLAQLVAPPLQPGPVRLPGPVRPQVPALPSPQQAPGSFPVPPSGSPPSFSLPVPGAAALPPVRGFNPYSPAELDRILATCSAIADPQARFSDCASALSARLFSDGYINTRVTLQATTDPSALEVIAGRIEEIQVSSSSRRLERRLARLLHPLRGSVLHLPSLTLALTQAQRLPGVGLLRTNLNRLGEDSTRALLLVKAEPSTRPIQGELSLRNDGNGGSGQFRGLGTLVKGGLLVPSDLLLLFGEGNSDSDPEIGSLNGSVSYTLPLGQSLAFTTAFGASRRSLVEAPEPFHDLSYRQLQLLGQLDLTLRESLRGRWYVFAGVSANRNDAYLAGRSFPAIVGGGDDGWLLTGFLRFGTGFDGLVGPLAFGGSLYGLQGIAGFSNQQQLQELAFIGVDPGRSRAIGTQMALSWPFAPRWQLDLLGAAQFAFNPLTNPMGFSLGSDNGLRGLPGQLVSGDSGLLGSSELSWSLWRGHRDEIQLVPFIGAGTLSTSLRDATFSDSAGAGGVLVRWRRGQHGLVEVGWVRQFLTKERPFWNEWLLGNGLYTKLSYRF